MRQVVAAFLQSPFFLYRAELGTTGSVPATGSLKLTGYELASRLSFALWNQAPDSTLLNAAATGLSTTAEVSAQASRLINDPRFGASAASFTSQLLGIAPASNRPMGRHCL